MDVHNTIGGSLQISTEVIAKIARLAALEVDGVADVATGTSQNVRSLLGRTGLQKPVTVVMEDGIATVTVHLTVVYGSKVMPLCEKVQENVKQTIQNMTGITVSRVSGSSTNSHQSPLKRQTHYPGHREGCPKVI